MSLVRPQLLARLRLDLEELYGSPYPGVEVIPNERDLRKMCLLLSPPAGPWKGLRLHFDVELPTNWPTSPPKVKNSVHGIEHPNLFGDYICCDLLKEHFYAEEGYTGGYTPALTLRGLFLQFLTFFSSNSVDQEYGGSVYIGEADQVFYHYESELVERLTSTSGYYRSELTSQQLRQREQEWHADTSEEVLITRYGSGEGKVTQLTKRGMQDKTPASRLVKLTYPNPRFISTASYLSRWKCKQCEYGTPALSHMVDGSQPSQELTPPDSPSLALIPPPVCLLPKLNDDVLYALAGHLPSESLLSFSIAYPRLHHVITEGHVLLQRELRCFFLRTPLRAAILGIGIEHDAQARTLHSEFDWLSQEAFEQFGVRKSITKRSFDHFLPLAFGNAHFNRARREIWKTLYALDDHISRNERLARSPPAKPMHPLLVTGPRKNPIQSVRVLFKFMNNIVVSLMKSCDDALASSQGNGGNAAILHASEKAIVAYCQLFHLLICLCVSAPDVIVAATQCVKAFVTEPRSRHKDQLADLGEFIVLSTLVLAVPPVKLPGQTKPPPVIGWKTHLNGPMLEEVLTRNARWVLKEVPGLEVYERGESDYRLNQTFHHSRTSLRLVMFQIAFLDLITAVPAGHTTNLARRLGRSYGFPEKVNPGDRTVPEQMVERIKAIYKVQSWPEFFDRVQFANGRAWGKEKFADVLRECMKESGKRGYHRAAMGGRLEGLKSERNLREREWNEQILKAKKAQK